MKVLKQEQGISLIEVVASILLIGIILLSFFTLLIQSNKTTHKSNGIMNSTYIAQTEIEKLYTNSSNACTFEDIARGYILNETKQVKYSSLPNRDKVYNFDERTDGDYEFYLSLETFSENTIYANAIYVHLDVIEIGTNSKATMENVFELGGKPCAQ